MNVIKRVGFQLFLESFADFIFDIFQNFRWKFFYEQNKFHTKTPGWCLMKCKKITDLLNAIVSTQTSW